MAANFNNNIVFRTTSAVATEDYTMLRAGVIYDAYSIANAGTAGSCTLGKAGVAFTSAMNVNAAVNTLARTTVIDATLNSFAVGDTLRLTKTATVSTDTFGYLAATGVSA